MKRRSIFLLAAMLLLLALAFFLVPGGPREPVHQGKRLTQWIHEAVDIGIFEQTPETDAAMKAFGTNALPFLLKEFTRPISPWRTRLKTWASKLFRFNIHPRADEERIRTAANGLILLGTNAAPAIPVVMRYLDDSKYPRFPVETLHALGDAALPHLAAALSPTNPAPPTNAVKALATFAHSPGPGREALAVVLRHPSPEIRRQAVKAWTLAVVDREERVPDLLNMAKDPSPLVAQEASNQLAWLSRQRAPSVRAAANAALLTLGSNAVSPRAP